MINFIVFIKKTIMFDIDYIIWFIELDKLKKYINEKQEKPHWNSRNIETKNLYIWLSSQIQNYKFQKNQMKNEDIRETWEKFCEEYYKYFKTEHEIWYENLNKVKNYIEKNNKRPAKSSKDLGIQRLGKWIDEQIRNYRRQGKIMKDESVKNDWLQFLTQYSKYFRFDSVPRHHNYKVLYNYWNANLNSVIDYINKYQKKPSKSSKDPLIKRLAKWMLSQQYKYKYKLFIMKNEEIRNLWYTFIEEYHMFFKKIKKQNIEQNKEQNIYTEIENNYNEHNEEPNIFTEIE